MPSALTVQNPAIPHLRDYQANAVQAVLASVTHGGTVQLRMACGTGKSLTAQRAAEAVLDKAGIQGRAAVVAVMAPSLALVKQFLDGWRRNAAIGPVRCLAVCSDATIGQANETTSTTDLDADVTTDVDAVANFLSQLPPDGVLLIVSTYASAAVLAEGVRAAGRPLDMLICDEAHHLAGNPSKPLRNLVTAPEWLPSARRLYMTATPRLYTERIVGRSGLSMDDQDLFGPAIFEYAFPQAISEGHLDDYRALVTVVENAQVREILTSLHENEGRDDSDVRSTVVAQVALLRAWQELGVARAIAFCDSIRGSKVFTLQLRAVAGMLGYDPGQIEALHVDGSMSSHERAPVLDALAAPSDGRLVVVSNARCLGEGVDVPSVDAVLFACPKRSEIDIIQSVGRALRRGPNGRGIAKLILPMVLPEAPGGELDPNALSGTEYEPAWTVIRALRDIDGELGAHLDRLRMSSGPQPDPRASDPDCQFLPGKIEFAGAVPEAAVLREIAVAMVGHTTSPWLDGYALLKSFHERTGHFDVPLFVRMPDGKPLARWITCQREAYEKGLLPPDRIAQMESLGFVWDEENALWWQYFENCIGSGRDWYWLERHTVRTAKWMEEQRQAILRQELAGDRTQALRESGFHRWVGAVTDGREAA